MDDLLLQPRRRPDGRAGGDRRRPRPHHRVRRRGDRRRGRRPARHPGRSPDGPLHRFHRSPVRRPPARPDPGLEAVTDPGTFCWAECHSVDAEAAKAFYRAVFAWQEQDVPLGEAMYTVLTPAGGGTDDAHGGLMQLSPGHTAAGTGSHWLPYFEVPNVDAAVALAERLRATVRIPPTDVHGVGRLARLADPYGAVFAVITSAATSG
ncbi:VOC family protein [Kitasatospora aburaviensis]